jgi:hypothetical protein
MESLHSWVQLQLHKIMRFDRDGERAAAARMARSFHRAHQKTRLAKNGYESMNCLTDILFAPITPDVAKTSGRNGSPPWMASPLSIIFKAIPINAMMFIWQGYDLRATSSAAEASMPPSCGSSR